MRELCCVERYFYHPYVSRYATIVDDAQIEERTATVSTMERCFTVYHPVSYMYPLICRQYHLNRKSASQSMFSITAPGKLS